MRIIYTGSNMISRQDDQHFPPYIERSRTHGYADDAIYWPACEYLSDNKKKLNFEKKKKKK